MSVAQTRPDNQAFFHAQLPSGIELAVDPLPERNVAAIIFRVLAGVSDEPADLNGIGMIVERTLSKGTQVRDGRALADAFDLLGAQWGSASGRQSMMVRTLSLPEFALDVVDLVAEMLSQPTFPDEACRVAVQLALEQRKHLDDDPNDLLRMHVAQATLGPVYGRHTGGQLDTLPRITPDSVRAHWQTLYHAGRLQVAAAGPLDPERLAAHVEKRFSGLRRAPAEGRDPADFELPAQRTHIPKELQQQYISLSLPGLPKDHPEFAVEQVLIGVLSGGMSGRLFTEVREKRGLCYSVSAGYSPARDHGIVSAYVGTMPDRAQRSLEVLLAEMQRINTPDGRVTREEFDRAIVGMKSRLIFSGESTAARAGALATDYHKLGRARSLAEMAAEIDRLTVDTVNEYLSRRSLGRLTIQTLGPEALVCPDAAA
ncbi:MAG: insulinase family protein [Phycisphaerae bacterium]|nr:insulinase family protein [Phycisphaerae bacterium]